MLMILTSEGASAGMGGTRVSSGTAAAKPKNKAERKRMIPYYQNKMYRNKLIVLYYGALKMTDPNGHVPGVSRLSYICFSLGTCSWPQPEGFAPSNCITIVPAFNNVGRAKLSNGVFW